MSNVLLEAVARLVFLPSLAVAAAILVKGYSDAGDGFTAGIVAALGVLLQYAAFGRRRVARHLPVEHASSVALAGLALALAIAFGPLLLGDEAVTHYPRPGAPVVHLGTLELLTAVAFDVGVFLLVLGVTVGAVDALARAAEREEDA